MRTAISILKGRGFFLGKNGASWRKNGASWRKNSAFWRENSTFRGGPDGTTFELKLPNFSAQVAKLSARAFWAQISAVPLACLTTAYRSRRISSLLYSAYITKWIRSALFAGRECWMVHEGDDASNPSHFFSKCTIFSQKARFFSQKARFFSRKNPLLSVIISKADQEQEGFSSEDMPSLIFCKLITSQV